MGFIDWISKDSKVETENEEDQNENVDDVDESVEPEIDDLDDLRQISNAEKFSSNDYDNSYDNTYNTSYEDSEDSELVAPKYSPAPQNASFTIFKVVDEEDVRLVLKHLSQNLTCIATFEGIHNKKQFNLVMNYLKGGLYVLMASMTEWQKDAYILVPRGMTINTHSKSKRKK